MKLYYCKWTEDDIKGLHSILEATNLYTESDEQGMVLREIAFDKWDKVTHRYPSNTHSMGRRGIFDTQTVELFGTKTPLTKEEFEAIWRLT